LSFCAAYWVALGLAHKAPELFPTPQLIEAWGEESVNSLTKSNPQLVLYYNLWVQKGWYIQPLSPEKAAADDNLPTVQLSDTDLAHPNILRWQKQLGLKKGQRYKIANTSNILVLLPEASFVSLYNEATARVYTPN
jgi:hypothetical protein